jgi:membrane glycosyltransferase
MFAGVPAMTLGIALAPLKLLDGEDLATFPAGLALALYLTFLGMYIAPKLAGLADIVLARGVAGYGGAGRLAASAAIEIGFAFLLGAVTTFRLTIFMIGLAFGRTISWNGQARDAEAVPWPIAVRELWPVTLFGLAVCGSLALVSFATLAWSLPLTLGYLTAIPFAVTTASPSFGAWLTDRRLCAIPEELEPPPEFASLASH